MFITFTPNGNELSEVAGDYKLPAKMTGTHASRYALVDGKVVDQFAGKTDDEVIAAQQASAAVVAVVVQNETRLTKLEYMNRFKDAELAAIFATAKVSAEVEVWLAKFNASEFISKTDPVTIGGLQALEAAGLLAKGRAAEILA